MLEYVPRDRLVAALSRHRRLMNRDGLFILFMTRRNWLTRLLVGQWWQSNLHNGSELEEAFRRAGFADVAFGEFPPLSRLLAVWGHIVEARACRLVVLKVETDPPPSVVAGRCRRFWERLSGARTPRDHRPVAH
jgi:hypothetical protein